ncbi:MAG: hypothetical protein ABSA18_17625 [Dehalococcoidia bacterium]
MQFFRPKLRCEIMCAQLQKIGDEEKTSGAGGGHPALEEPIDVMSDAVTGNLNFTRFTGAIENCYLLFSQKPRR